MYVFGFIQVKNAKETSKAIGAELSSPNGIAKRWSTLQAMANDSELNIENNIRKRDTQFINIFWLKTLENQIKCILLCILLEHTGGINMFWHGTWSKT